MDKITEFFQNLWEFIENLWNLRNLLIVAAVIFVVFFVYDRIIATIAHHNEVFKGGRKDD